MNRIEEMIRELCPEEVEYHSFGELCNYIRGITYNKSQEAKAATEDSWRVFRANNITLSSNTLNFDDVKLVSKNVKVKEIQLLRKGDILICAGSGSKEHVGKVAYISEDIDYTFGGFMAVIRCPEKLNSRFLFHLLTSRMFSDYLCSALNSTTINNLSAGIIKDFLIPVPPLAIQNEIVNILDKFTELEAELEAELESELDARRVQYEYYRNKLLTFNGITPPLEGEVKWLTMNEIGTLVRGSGLQKKDFVEHGIGCIHYGQIYTYYGTFAKSTKSFVLPLMADKLTKVEQGDLIIACTSENVDDICKTVAWLGDSTIVTGGHAIVFKHRQNAKYLAYYFQTKMFFDQKRKYARGTKVMDITVKDLEKIVIPIPPIEEQQRIVAILDKFETLVNDISEGLPAEIAARRQQYEYYRDKLLTFKRKEDGKIQPCS